MYLNTRQLVLQLTTHTLCAAVDCSRYVKPLPTHTQAQSKTLTYDNWTYAVSNVENSETVKYSLSSILFKMALKVQVGQSKWIKVKFLLKMHLKKIQLLWKWLDKVVLSSNNMKFWCECSFNPEYSEIMSHNQMFLSKKRPKIKTNLLNRRVLICLNDNIFQTCQNIAIH